MKFLSWFILVHFLCCHTFVNGQKYGYEVLLEPMDIPGLGGLQSYAYGRNGDEWLILGGRLDGLHRRQPFASFSPDGNNNQILVVNPVKNQVWSRNLDDLPMDLKEQLSSTNMQFYQFKNTLILTGGYAFSESARDFVTFPFLTVIDVPKLINDIKGDAEILDGFIQIKDDEFAVTGGRMGMINDTFYLVGGHRFIGRYNPMGPDHGPGFSQTYTHEIRKFSLEIKAEVMVEHFPPIHDELNLRRRDYNLIPMLTEGENQLMLFSGVFQKNANLPWLYPVQITSKSHTPIEKFHQRYNHYHCATLPIYNKSTDEMHSLFFGGIAQFYLDDNMVVQDNDVPFVNTITDVYWNKGNLIEKPLDVKMPALLGTGAELILSSQAPVINEGIINGDEIGSSFMEIGYIYGGIVSSDHNIFWVNTGKESKASSTIYKVSIKKQESTDTDESGVEESTLLLYPNPDSNTIKLGFTTEKAQPLSIDIFDLEGNKVGAKAFAEEQIKRGMNFLEFAAEGIDYGAFIYHLKIGNKTIIRKVVWSE